MIVTKATPLIYLAKINTLHLLKEKFKTVLISHKVWKETVEGENLKATLTLTLLKKP